MRSTPVALALALTCLSATPSDAANSAPRTKNVTRLEGSAYGCYHGADTLAVYRLFGRDDEASKVELNDFLVDAAHTRLCRSFSHPAIDVVLPDDGDGLTCITDAYALWPASESRLCYWVPSRKLIVSK